MDTVTPKTQPRTLLQMAGALPQAVTWAEAVLLLIDVQQEYVSGALPLGPAGEAAIVAAARLRAAARDRGAPVIHVTHHGRPGGALFDPETEAVRIVDALTPAADETVVIKALPNAFAGTSLEADIRALGRNQILVAGFMIHMCVSSTVRAALDLGFRSVVCADACATRDLPLGADVVPAAEVHRAAMAALADRFATVLTLAESLKTA